MENKKQELSSVWRVGFLITYLHTLMWTEVFNVRPSVLKLFPPAVQSSAFVLKTSPGDNFAPDRAFSNLSICGVGRAEATLPLPPAYNTEAEGAPESSFIWPQQEPRSFLWKAQGHVFWEHSQIHVAF